MVEASPAAALVMSKAEFLLEFLIIALDPPAQLGQIDQPLEGDVVGNVANQYLVGSFSPGGHSISSHSSGLVSLSRPSRWAARTRTLAKREVSQSADPSRQVI